MTPKEKSIEIVEKYVDIQSELEETTQFYWGYAVKCALISVNELINDTNSSSPFEVERLVFWSEVKQEIEKL